MVSWTFAGKQRECSDVFDFPFAVCLTFNVVVQGLEIDRVGGQIADQIRTEWFAEPRILAEEELRRLEAQKAPDE